jgi:uncharacterized C2H2 Zn-finger protein
MNDIITHKRFKCVNCLYSTNRKYDLKRHLNAIHKVVNVEILEKLLSEGNVPPNEGNVPPTEGNVPPNEKNVNQKEKMCKFCNKIYKTDKYFIEHVKKCKGIDNLTCPKCMISFSSRQHKSRHINSNNCKARSIMYARKTSDNDTNITYNITNITNNNIIYVNNYGNERKDYLNYDKMFEIFKKGYDIPTFLTKEIHFNKQFPENNNIIHLNDKSSLIKKEDEYILKDLNLLVDELIMEKSLHMKDFAIKNKNNICSKLDMNLYEDIIEHLLNLILSKENLENYKIQIKKIKDMIKNNNN